MPIVKIPTLRKSKTLFLHFSKGSPGIFGNCWMRKKIQLSQHNWDDRDDSILKLFGTPMAMLWHLGMASDVCDFPHCPVILPSKHFAYYSHSFFEDSMEDMNNIESSPFLKCDAIMSQGMLTFCEALKVDLQSCINSKNQDTTHNSTMVNTISLITSLFFDVMNMNVAVESGFRKNWSDMKRAEISGPDSVIWNRGQSKKNKASCASTHYTTPPMVQVLLLTNCVYTKAGVHSFTMNTRRTYCVY